MHCCVKVVCIIYPKMFALISDFLETEKAREAYRQYYKQHGVSAAEKPFLFHSPSGAGPYDSQVSGVFPIGLVNSYTDQC